MATIEQMERMKRVNSQTNFLTTKSSQVEKDLDASMDSYDADKEETLARLDALKKKIDSTNEHLKEAKDRMKAVIRDMQMIASKGDLQILKTKLEKWKPADKIPISEFINQMEEDL